MWWTIATAWWTLNGFATGTNYHLMQQGAISLGRALGTAMASAWLWIPLTVLALWLSTRFPVERSLWGRRLVLYVVAALGICVLRALAVLVLNPWIGWYEVLPTFPRILVTSVANNFFLFGMLVGVGHALVYARRFRERDEQLARVELHALKMQLQPHFLFNALNTVASHVHTDPDVAERMIARLSELLRHVLESGGTQEVPLEEELDFLRTYLYIEQARFEHRLRVRWEIDAEVRGARVPHLLLQPLVENAVRHGIAPRVAGGTIEVEIRRREGDLHLHVRDDGLGITDGGRSTGVGLSNTRARLRQLYGARHHFEVGAVPSGGTHVHVVLPFRREEA